MAGIACIALLSTAVMVMKEAKNNEYRDAMDYYALEGFEIVRSISSDADKYFQIADTCNGTEYGFLEDTEDENFDYARKDTLTPMTIDEYDARCSLEDVGESGYCEKLPMPGNEDVGETFYREISVEDASNAGDCSRARVTVHVGLFPVPGAGPVRNFDTYISLVGYVVE